MVEEQQSELKLTKTLAGAALLLMIVAIVTAPRNVTPSAFLDQGEPFFPDFEDPNVATTLEVIEFDEDTPRIFVTGISGKPMMVPVITVGVVRVGSAEVEDVEMAVLDTQSTGLLGMTFFNHFKVSTDPARGLLTLEEIDLNAVAGVYGGLGERAWRNKFAYLNAMLAKVESHRGNPQSYPELEEQLDGMQDYWEGQLDSLELKASRAGVPRAWRE